MSHHRLLCYPPQPECLLDYPDSPYRIPLPLGQAPHGHFRITLPQLIPLPCRR